MGFKFAFNGCCSDPALDVYWAQFRDPTDFDAGMFIESSNLFTEGGIEWDLVWEYQAKFEGVKRTQGNANHVTNLWVDPQGYSASVFSPIVELDTFQRLNNYTVAVANPAGGVIAKYRLGDTFENARYYPDQGPGISYAVLDYALVAPNRWLILYEKIVYAKDRPDITLDWEPLTTLDPRGNSFYWPALPHRAERSGQWNEWHISYHLSERDFENRKIGEDCELSGGPFPGSGWVYAWRNVRWDNSYIAPVEAHSGRWAAYLAINWDTRKWPLIIPAYDRPVSWGGTGDEATVYDVPKEEEPPRFFQVTGGSDSVHATPLPLIDSGLPDADESIWGVMGDVTKDFILDLQTDRHGTPWIHQKRTLQLMYGGNGSTSAPEFKAFPLDGTLSTFYGAQVLHGASNRYSKSSLIPDFGVSMYVHDLVRTTKITKDGAAKDSYYLRENPGTYHMVEWPGEVLWHVLSTGPLNFTLQSANSKTMVWGSVGFTQSEKPRLWGIKPQSAFGIPLRDEGLLQWVDVSDDNIFIEATIPGNNLTVRAVDFGVVPSPKADFSSEVRNYPGHPAIAHATNLQDFDPDKPTVGGSAVDPNIPPIFASVEPQKSETPFAFESQSGLFNITSATSDTGETTLTIEGYYYDFKDKDGEPIFNQAQLFEIMKNSVLDNEEKHMQLEVDGYTLEEINAHMDPSLQLEIKLHDWR